MKDSTLPVQIAHPSKARFPNPIGHWQRSNDRGWPEGKEGGGGDLKLRIDRRTILTEVQ